MSKPTSPAGPEVAPAVEDVPRGDLSVVAAKIPPITRMAMKVPEPKNWQDFQRACVVLFSAELNDPHAVEYGRAGQYQAGIDIIARRDGKPEHFVGIQCRRVEKPLTYEKMLADCRAALTIEAGLKEIIFATTAPDDTGATNDAIAAEKLLRSEGHNLVIAYYGWDALQTRIALHPSASAIFNPAAYVNNAPQALAAPLSSPDVATQISEILAIVKGSSVVQQSSVTDSVDRSAEDPALHARIDVLRDLFQKDHQIALAERQLLDLLAKTSAEERPWARFRIETNLGSIEMELGREAEAIVRFETAYALRPDDGNAIANLALARTIQGKYDEAFELAHKALDASPRSEAAVAYLLQAAARSNWQGDPETLIPADLTGHVAAAFGIAEFLRRREAVDWPERTIALAEQHPDSEEMKRCGALAVLELAVRNQSILGGAGDAVTLDQINRAADDLKAIAERYIANGYAHEHDLLAYVNNGAVLLRIADRNAEAEALLVAGMKHFTPEPGLYRLLALTRAAQGRKEEAIKTLEQCDDPECAMLRAEMVAVDNGERALEIARSIVTPDRTDRLAELRWRMLGEIALRLKRFEIVAEAVAGLRKTSSNLLAADLLDVRSQLRAVENREIPAVDEEEDEDAEPQARAPAALLALVDRVDADTSPLLRYELAETLMRHDCPEAVVGLLEHHVDLSRATPPSELYLQALAAARRDEEFERAIARATPKLSEDPDILWTRTARAWNIGDLPGALRTIDLLIEKRPDHAGAQLLKIDILARSDRTAELLTELEKPLEAQPWRRLEDRARLAGYLAHFGHVDRAIALAYCLFLANRDVPRAWLTLSSIVLEQGQSLEDSRWEAATVAENTAVDLRFSDGEALFVVVEPDMALRQIDQDSYPPDHALVQRLLGLRVGDTFEDSSGRSGTIEQLRHKYVARFQYVLNNFSTRFPEVGGFRKITIDPESDDPVGAIRAEARARTEWIEQEQRQYINGNWPLGILAVRVGVDVIEAAGGIVSTGSKLKVANGDNAEGQRSAKALRANGARGCTLDLLTFWNAWSIGALNAITSSYGRVHVAQSVVDRLRLRRDKFDAQIPKGIKWASYDDGTFSVTEVPSQIVQTWRDQTQEALDWLTANAVIAPVIASDAIPELLRDHLRRGRSDLFDCVVLALQTDTVLICDDLFTRNFMQAVTGRCGAWLQLALAGAVAKQQGLVDDYVRWFATLVDLGQSYLGIDGGTLARAAALDASVGRSPGPLFTSLSTLVGGAIAEPRSHVTACLTCMQILWNDPKARAYRQPVTGLLLERLICERPDYKRILYALMLGARGASETLEYIGGWLVGHFISLEAVFPEAAKRRRKRLRKSRGRKP